MDDSTKRNLKDAGCDEEFIERYCKCENDRRQCKKMLSEHRRRLLEQLHEKEDNVSCLDYLVYKIKKDEENDGNTKE